nr:hypothetical protein [Erwinia sp. Ejp617]
MNVAPQSGPHCKVVDGVEPDILIFRFKLSVDPDVLLVDEGTAVEFTGNYSGESACSIPFLAADNGCHDMGMSRETLIFQRHPVAVA